METNFYIIQCLLLSIKELEDVEITTKVSSDLLKLHNQLIFESGKIYGSENVYI